MAHKGKLAPVVFRRDYNLNVANNDSGWYNRYFLTFPVLPTGLAGFWSHSTWELGPGKPNPVDELVWESEHVPKFGLHWFVDLRVRINNGRNYTRVSELFTEEFGVCGRWLRGLDQWQFPNLSGIFSGETLLFYDPDFFDLPPNNVGAFKIVPKIWSDGPPH